MELQEGINKKKKKEKKKEEEKEERKLEENFCSWKNGKYFFLKA